MTKIKAESLHVSGEPQVQVMLLALQRAVSAPQGDITAATETQVQNTLHALRSTYPRSAAVEVLESVARSLRVLSEAKREGRCNLYMSQLLRLRKQLCA